MSISVKPLLRLLTAALFVTLSGCGGSDPGPGGGQDDELTSLPEDTGGTHTAHVLGSTAAAFGYYVYLPSGYTGGSHSYPLIVFLHGKSERGDGTNSPTVLAKVLNNGIPKLIKNGQWDPTYPAIVISPQFHIPGGNENNWGAGDPAYLKAFIDFTIASYRINTKRIYLTGLSHGGNGVYDYISKTEDATNHIAAAVPIAAWGSNNGYAKCKNTPIWVFVGEDDTSNANTSKSFVTAYNAQSPGPTVAAKITIFKDAGHDVWTRTYSGSAIGTGDSNFDIFNEDIYDWMFQYKRSAD